MNDIPIRPDTKLTNRLFMQQLNPIHQCYQDGEHTRVLGRQHLLLSWIWPWCLKETLILPSCIMQISRKDNSIWSASSVPPWTKIAGCNQGIGNFWRYLNSMSMNAAQRIVGGSMISMTYSFPIFNYKYMSTYEIRYRRLSQRIYFWILWKS